MAIKASNQISLVDVTDAYNVILTSEAYTFVGGTTGVGSGSACTTEAVAYCGTNQCSSVTVSADDITVPTNISATVSNSGTSKVTIKFTTTGTVSSACEATIPVTVDGITINKKFSFAVAKTGATGSKGDKGDTGKGISNTAITYQVGTSATSAPTGTWSSSVVATSKVGEYLWTRTIITYSDNTTSTSYSVSAHGATGSTGATGKGISSTSITYQVGTSATSAPTGTWSSSVVSTSKAGQYLWTRTIITYTDNTTSTSYSVSAHGATGATGATGAAAITLSITTSAGTVFKNNSGSTVLTAHVYQGGAEKTISSAGVVADSLGTIKWYKVGTSTAVATANTLTVSASDVTNVQAYTCQLEG